MKSRLFLILFFPILVYGNTQEACDKLIATAVEAMQQKDYSRSLELLADARTMAQKNNWHKQHFLALNNMGANYYSMLDYGEALNYYLDAYTLAIKELDVQQEMTVLNNIAILFLREKNYKRAIEYLEKAYLLANRIDDQKKIALYAVNLGLASNSNNDLDKATLYLKKAISLKNENPAVIIQAKIGLADNYLLRKEYSKARELSLELMEHKEMNQVSDLKLTVLLILSKVFEAEGDIQNAKAYAINALDNPTNIENRILVYEQLAGIYTKSGEFQFALNAKDTLLNLNDELNKIKNGKLYETNKVKFEIQNYQRELQSNTEKLAQQRKNYLLLLGGSVIAILLIGWALRNSFIRNKQNKIIHERNQKLIALELEKKQSDNLLLEKQIQEKETRSLLEEERLKNEIETRNRKLSAKALYLSERNELIATIIQNLTNNPDLKDNKTIKEQIKKLKSLLNTEDEWDEFIKHFEEVNHGFLMSLKARHPELNANDIRFLTYIYMNLSHKEIASLLSITPEACRKRKERISKKMALEDSTQLFSYLSSF